jgi:hypothetical protein
VPPTFFIDVGHHKSPDGVLKFDSIKESVKAAGKLAQMDAGGGHQDFQYRFSQYMLEILCVIV